MDSENDPAAVVALPAAYSQGGFAQIRTVVVPSAAKSPELPALPASQETADNDPTTPTDLVA